MRKYISFFLSLTLFGLPAIAQNSFDDILNTIVDNNTDIQSQARMAQAQRLDDADANSLANPSVAFARVWGRHDIGNKLQLDISQEFEWPGVYGARRQAAESNYLAANAEIEAARFALSNEARVLLTELVYVRHQIALINHLQASFQSLKEAIDEGVRGGELTILDQRKMQIESYEIDNDMTTALSRQEQIKSALQAVTTAPLQLDGITAYPVLPLLSLDEYLAKIENDPYVQEQLLAAEYETLSAKAASKGRMPGFTVGYQHQAEMGDRFNGFTVGMSLPFFEGRDARRAALERKEAADLSREMLIAKRTAEIKGTYSELEIERNRLVAYNATFGDNKYLDLLLKAYRGGQISVIEYLSEVHYYHQAMITYLEAEYNYNLALATLNCYN